MTDKIVATSKRALLKKYGNGGFAQIWSGLQALIAADQLRGITTSLVNLDTGKALTATPVRLMPGALGERATKLAINSILRNKNPAYLMILGGPDVVRHQHLHNPVPGPDDDDPDVPSDLPYASASAHSKDIIDHLGPTHVVGRLPDLPGAKKPDFLLKLLKFAVTAQTIAAANYRKCYGLSVEDWKISTQMSLSAIFGGTPPLHRSPPTTPPVKRAQLKPRSHFINCHGGDVDFHFYGQHGNAFPISMDTPDNRNRITRGTVASVECCYGAQIYDPTKSTDMGLCCGYLLDGAHGFFGSTNIAYGPVASNGAADFITQYFLQEVAINGASLGRACLLARQRFLQTAGPVLSPIDLKTIGQFLLLGDPSIHPARPKLGPALPVAGAAFGVRKSEEAARVGRREELAAQGASLPQTLMAPKGKRKAPPAGSPARRQLLQLARQLKMKRPKITTLGVAGSARPAPGMKAVGALATPPTMHVMTQALKSAKRVKNVRALIVYQYGPTLVTKQDVVTR